MTGGQKADVVMFLQQRGYYVVCVGDGPDDEKMIIQSDYGIVPAFSAAEATQAHASASPMSEDVRSIASLILAIGTDTSRGSGGQRLDLRCLDFLLCTACLPK